MSAYLSSRTRPGRSSVIALLIAAGVLYLASEVLIPLAMAILLSFLLVPAVRRLEHWKLPRLAATLIVSLFGFGVIFAIAGVAASQAVSLGFWLPGLLRRTFEQTALRQSVLEFKREAERRADGTTRGT